MIDAHTLRLITQNGLQNFALGRILDGIAALRTLLPFCAAETIICAEAESLEENYHHMLSFLRAGGGDEKRGEVQEKIQRQGVSLLFQANRTIRLSLNKDLYCQTLSHLNEVYEEPKAALLEKWNSLLTPEEAGEVQDDLFDLLWTSAFWSAEDTAFWYDFLLQQRDMVQQHLAGALFLSLWEYYDAEKMQLLYLLAESECHRTRIQAISYLLLLRLCHKELVPLMPSLPASLLSRKGKKQVAQVQYEFLLMLVGEKDLEKEIKEAESVTKELLSGKEAVNAENIKNIISLRGRYLRNRLQRGLDINLSKIPLLHNCKYLHRTSHWFMPFDKTHPLFQSVMIDEKGNEKHHLSTMVDFILDCDIDKLAMLYLVSNDKDFSKAVQQLDEQELPDMENAVIPEYTFRFIMQDLFRFFGHSPVHSQLINPFRGDVTLFDFPELAKLFSIDDAVSCCKLLFEIDRGMQVLPILDNVINRHGANADALLLKAQVLREQKKLSEAINQGRSAEMLEPDNIEVLHFLFECYSEMGRSDEGLEYLQKLAELMPDNKTLPFLIATTLGKTSRTEEALELFFKLDYESSPDDKDYHLIVSTIAETALIIGKLDIAERYTQKELELSDGKRWEAHLRMGHIRLLQNDWKRALDGYEQFVNIFCKETGKDIHAALATLDKKWSVVGENWQMDKDFLLIHDILQALADNSPSPINTGTTAE